MAPATRKAYGASAGGQSQAAQAGPVRRAGPRGTRQAGGVREDRPHRSAVSGAAETAENDFGNFRNFRKRYANQGTHSPADGSLLGARHSSGAHGLCDPRRGATGVARSQQRSRDLHPRRLLGALSGAGNIGGRNTGHRRRACRVFRRLSDRLRIPLIPQGFPWPPSTHRIE
jgi:hypothetical protein